MTKREQGIFNKESKKFLFDLEFTDKNFICVSTFHSKHILLKLLNFLYENDYSIIFDYLDFKIMDGENKGRDIPLSRNQFRSCYPVNKKEKKYTKLFLTDFYNKFHCKSDMIQIIPKEKQVKVAINDYYIKSDFNHVSPPSFLKYYSISDDWLDIISEFRNKEVNNKKAKLPRCVYE